MDIKILSRLLGHTDVNITCNVYIHLFGDGFEEMYKLCLKHLPIKHKDKLISLKFFLGIVFCGFQLIASDPL